MSAVSSKLCSSPTLKHRNVPTHQNNISLRRERWMLPENRSRPSARAPASRITGGRVWPGRNWTQEAPGQIVNRSRSNLPGVQICRSLIRLKAPSTIRGSFKGAAAVALLRIDPCWWSRWGSCRACGGCKSRGKRSFFYHVGQWKGSRNKVGRNQNLRCWYEMGYEERERERQETREISRRLRAFPCSTKQ